MTLHERARMREQIFATLPLDTYDLKKKSNFSKQIHAIFSSIMTLRTI
jgi:hypothetical protein